MRSRPSVHLLQVAILGDGFVGKTAILRRLKGEPFEHDYVITVGADFVVKKMELGNKKVTLQIWDVGGQQQFAPLRSKYYSMASGVLIVFDIMLRKTFESIPIWLNEILENNNWRLVPVILVGNKNDLTENEPRNVTREEIDTYVQTLQEWGLQLNPNFSIKYFETSAKTGANVYQAFESLVNTILF